MTTDVGCCRELAEGGPDDTLGTAGLIVAPMDHEGFADAMQTLCEDAALRRRMGEVGRRRVEAHYRQETMMRSYRDLYEQVMGERGR